MKSYDTNILHKVGKENHENGGCTIEIFIRINPSKNFLQNRVFYYEIC